MKIDFEHIRPLIHLLGDLEVKAASTKEFNGKLMVWFHPHKGGRTAQSWLKKRLLKSFPRTDFFMPAYLKKISKPVAMEIATELHLLVAAIYESAKLNQRTYDEVVLVAYGEGVLIVRKVLEFGDGHLLGNMNPEVANLANDNWNEIRLICRTVFIARGQAQGALPSLDYEFGSIKNWWDKISDCLIQVLTH